MRFNLDSFNAAFAVLDDEQEKAQFVTGFSRGLNGASPKEGLSDAHSSGFRIGSLMRQEAILASERGAEFAKRKGTQRGPSRDPEGTLGEGSGLPEGLGLRFKDQGFPSQEEAVPRLEPVHPPAPPKVAKAKTASKPKPKLEEILGPKGSPDDRAYWELVNIFGASKNPAPTQTARAFVDALLTVPVHSILAKAQSLRDTLSGPQFMPQLQKWLDGQGYLNPDTPAAKSVSHRCEADAEYLAALAEGGISA